METFENFNESSLNNSINFFKKKYKNTDMNNKVSNDMNNNNIF